jgi:two-component system nitrate/nitrite response regulator NarL
LKEAIASDNFGAKDVPAASNVITVLLVDDHSLVRRSFRRLLEDEAGLVVIGEASDGEEAAALARRLRPDVVVMDFALPVITGTIAAQRILQTAPSTAILILSMHSEPVYVRAAVDVGARGYLLKSANLDLAAAVRAVAAGRFVLDPQLGLPTSAHGDAARPLSERRLEVLRLIALGKSNKEIAALLKIAPGTAAVHRADIMRELSVKKTAKLSLYALARGLLERKPKTSRPAASTKRPRKKAQ